ncbi:MAG: type II toxin-antitoxin system VapC family toxin [Caulobacteraceae bacterium]
MTNPELGVLDASVAVKCLLDEAGSEQARPAVAARADWIAPDLIFLEIASVALKSMRRGLIERAQAEAMVSRLARLLAETPSARSLAGAAFALAADHGFSAHDAAYLALAQSRGATVLTADAKLADRAKAAGLGHLVTWLGSA